MTLYTEIFCKYDLMHEDAIKNKIKPLKDELYEKLLHSAVGYFSKDCIRTSGIDLNKYHDMFKFEYRFIADGKSKELVLDPMPPDECNIFVAFRENSNQDYIEFNDFRYDVDRGIVTFDGAFKCNYDLYVCAYIPGYFEDDLDEYTMDILSYGMLTKFNISALEKQTLLNHSVYSSSSKTFSKAEHINAVNNVKKSILNDYLAMINEYTYKYDKNNLWNLTGRDYMYDRNWRVNS